MTKTVDCGRNQRPDDAYALSHGSRWPLRLGVMFRCESGGAQLMEALAPDVPEGVLLQLAPKGSFRLPQLLEFLAWDLGAADPTGDDRPGATAEVILLDWFAPHLHESVDDLVESKGHIVLRIPGGATPWVAPPDTHAHQPYEREYKTLERWDAHAQLRRGKVLPCTARTTVMTRAMAAWKAVPHDRNATRQFVETGITNALDGSEDACIRHLCRPFWYELDMPGVREQLRAEIREEVAANRLGWDQWRRVLVPYDDHPPAREGEEVARVRMSGPKPDGEEDGRPEVRHGPASHVTGSHWTSRAVAGLRKEDSADTGCSAVLASRRPGARRTTSAAQRPAPAEFCSRRQLAHEGATNRGRALRGGCGPPQVTASPATRTQKTT